MYDLQRYPWNLNLIKQFEENLKCVFFLWISPLFLMQQSLLQRKPKIKRNSLKKQNRGYLINIWSDKAVKGTVVYRALPYMQKGSIEMTFTVPLSYITICVFLIRVFVYSSEYTRFSIHFLTYRKLKPFNFYVRTYISNCELFLNKLCIYTREGTPGRH